MEAETTIQDVSAEEKSTASESVKAVKETTPESLATTTAVEPTTSPNKTQVVQKSEEKAETAKATTVSETSKSDTQTKKTPATTVQNDENESLDVHVPDDQNDLDADIINEQGNEKSDTGEEKNKEETAANSSSGQNKDAAATTEEKKDSAKETETSGDKKEEQTSSSTTAASDTKVGEKKDEKKGDDKKDVKDAKTSSSVKRSVWFV